MDNIPKIKLSEFFKLFAPTHVLGTTYTLSLAFFESVVFPFINKTHLQSCLIVCDMLGFQRAVEEAVALRVATHGYMTVTAPT